MITLLFWLGPFLHAQSPRVYEADCGALHSIFGGAGTLPYTQIQIRKDGGGYSLSMYDTRNRSQRSLRIQWDGHLKQHVARSNNGEDWSFMQKPLGKLMIRTNDDYTNCEPLPDPAPVAKDAFDGKPYDVEHIWRATQDIARGCGTALTEGR